MRSSMSVLQLIIFYLWIRLAMSCDLSTCPQLCTCLVNNNELTVDCGDKNMDALPENIPKCDGVTSLVLNMSHNIIAELDLKKYWDYSISVDLSSNRISKINVDHELLEDLKLHDLNLVNNSLETMPRNCRELVEKCDKVHLGQNRWNCNCDIRWLIKMIKVSNNLKFIDIEDITCDKPSEFLNNQLKDVEVDCHRDNSMPPSHIAAIVVSILFYLSISSVIALYITMRRRFPVTSSE